MNSGYWGVPIREGEKYSFSMSVKGDEQFAGKPLKVSLRNEALDRIYAEAEVGTATTDWQKLSGTLVPDGTDNNGRLVVTAEGTGEFWLGMVSLFPPTYKDQPNGLRSDLAKLLADLKPSFIRFPGGCFVEGKKLDDAFRFADTIGPIEERKGKDSFWGYYTTDGLGYYEYLRFTEDLGADPIFCLNPGGNNGVERASWQSTSWGRGSTRRSTRSNSRSDRPTASGARNERRWAIPIRSISRRSTCRSATRPSSASDDYQRRFAAYQTT